MAVASQFIDLTDGAISLLPPDAINLVIVIVGADSSPTLVCCGDKAFASDTTLASSTLSSGVTAITATQLHYVKCSSATCTSVKLYYGVS